MRSPAIGPERTELSLDRALANSSCLSAARSQVLEYLAQCLLVALRRTSHGAHRVLPVGRHLGLGAVLELLNRLAVLLEFRGELVARALRIEEPRLAAQVRTASSASSTTVSNSPTYSTATSTNSKYDVRSSARWRSSALGDCASSAATIAEASCRGSAMPSMSPEEATADRATNRVRLVMVP